MSAIQIDTSQLASLAKDLRKAAPAVSKSFNAGLKAAGDIVAEEARNRASFSSRIPGSIKVRRAGVKVKVVAGGPGAEDAAPYEHGGKPGTFRHPVFGQQNVWVDQQARPYLGPAAEAKENEVLQAVLDAVDVTFRKLDL